MNPVKTSIGWADYTWNPVVGCDFRCKYCYARRMNNRFKWVKNWNKPKFFPERLQEPAKKIKPVIIFVGSMCDLFGPSIKEEWIFKTIEVCHENPQHTFMFLTKNPERYKDFVFPKNCMLGVTITDQRALNRYSDAIRYLAIRFKNELFASIEPIQGPFRADCLHLFDLVIIGAETGRNAPQPAPEWIASIDHPNIYYKKSLKDYEKNHLVFQD